ncbi:alpha-1,6-mannosyl-glycoprotein 4-beta-N-acetylglucosaminyltransferase-like [Liolophura sinensis]|uniref:alpha-1,6-mannosyl-glycoprotein 4-beta-N-acetylglucosaminyltransferase-like n=1 Tax=Liolophura sinensis TaxID=3198878 RepID=UPI003158548E
MTVLGLRRWRAPFTLVKMLAVVGTLGLGMNWILTLHPTSHVGPAGSLVFQQQNYTHEIAPYNRETLLSRTSSIPREWFSDAIMWGTRRKNPVYLSIGIPCIFRVGKQKYVVHTLNSLIKHSSVEEKSQMVLVLFLADFDEKYRQEIGEFLYLKYKEFVDSGFIQMIKAPKSFYPSLDVLKIKDKVSLSTARWRAKQNFDFAFNMLYSQSLSEYYLQLEDDVIAVPNYFLSIRDFVSQNDRQYKSGWVCLEFCSLGFIAKLYHTYDLEKLSQMLMLFHSEHPNDVTYLHFNTLMFQHERIIRKPTLFDHKGLRSSLKYKINSLKDPMFKADPNEVEYNDPDVLASRPRRNNPPANLSTTLKQYEMYTPQKFYLGEEEIFWSRDPKRGDTFRIVFDSPQHLSNISVKTGQEDFPEDFLQNGVLELGRSAAVTSPQLRCSDIVISKSFSKGHVVIDNLSRDLAIACVQIVVKERQTNWLIISELEIH